MTLRNAWAAALLAAWAAAMPVLWSGAAQAATITLTDGSTLVGEIVSLQGGVYTVRTPSGSRSLPAASVRRIEAASATPQSVGAPGPLRLAGSTTIGDELAPALLEAFATARGSGDLTWSQIGSAAEQSLDAKGGGGSFKARLSRHGSGTAFTALAAHEADIGMASRPIAAQEAETLTAAGLGAATEPGFENVLALDGLIVIVNRSNPLDSLTINQIRDVFAGRITDWKEIGGTPGPIHLYGRDRKSGTADTFNALVMNGTPVKPDIGIVEGSDGIALKVQGDPGSIGYAGFAYLGDNKALTIGTECGLTFQPSDYAVRTEEYPLSRRLYLYLPAPSTSPDARRFVDFALGGDGQALAKAKGFVDLAPLAAPASYSRNEIALDLLTLANDRAATPADTAAFLDYARHTVNGTRISTTFRFQYASATPDARAVRDIDRLAAFLKSPAAAGRSLFVVGFADGLGTAQGSRTLSESRARTVAALLRARGVEPKEVAGYGRIAPVACNGTPEGREKNRRVEVWLF